MGSYLWGHTPCTLLLYESYASDFPIHGAHKNNFTFNRREKTHMNTGMRLHMKLLQDGIKHNAVLEALWLETQQVSLTV
jgi:hypothetical protein